MTKYRTIHLHPQAPAKPAEGSACNGCGVCCAAGPCPVGWLVNRGRGGACRALTWDGQGQRYVCGLMARSGWRARWVGRWIGAGVGCDCSLVVQPPPAPAGTQSAKR